jgi:hypothetical protein
MAAVLVAAGVVHWLTKRAFFDRHLEHFLAAQYSAGLLMFGFGGGVTRRVVEEGTWSWPLFDLAFGVVAGGLAYWVVFAWMRRVIVREWDEHEGESEE